MNTKDLITAVLLFSTPFIALSQNEVNQSNLNNSQTSSSVPIHLSQASIELTLFEGETVRQSINVTNNGSENYTLGLSLSNTSFENRSDLPYLVTPIAYKVYNDRINAFNVFTGNNVNSRHLYTTSGYYFDDDGLAFDGKAVYHINNLESGMIYKLGNGIPNDDIFIPSFVGKKISALAHSGDFLYASSVDEEVIYKIDDETGAIVGQIPLPNLSNGLTFGGNRGTLFATTYENDDTYINEINIVTLEVVNSFLLWVESYSPFSEGLGYSRELDVLVVDNDFYQSITIDPDNGYFLDYVGQDFGTSIAAQESLGLEWLGLESVTLDANSGTSQQYEFVFGSASLSEGTYQTTVEFNLNDSANQKVSLPVELTILPRVDDIIMESFCAQSSGDGYKVKFDNPNHFNVDARWYLIGSGQTDNIVLKPGFNGLVLPNLSDSSGLVILTWSDELGDLQSSSIRFSGVTCVSGLTLSVVDTAVTSSDIQWELYNPNPFPITYDWSIDETDMIGSREAPSGSSFFSTPIIEQCNEQRVKIEWVNEIGKTVRHRGTFSGRPCEMKGLTLQPTACYIPDSRHYWSVINPNRFRVSIKWEAIDTNESGTRTIGAGGGFFRTRGDTVKITWLDGMGNPKRQQKTLTVPCSNTNARKAATTSEETIDPATLSQNHIYPNPFNNKLSIDIAGVEKDQEYQIMIYDLMGALIYEKTGKASSGAIQSEIYTETMPRGTYLLNVSYGDQIYHSKLIKE